LKNAKLIKRIKRIAALHWIYKL